MRNRPVNVPTINEPLAGGESVADVRERFATREAFGRVLPPFLRDAILHDNGGKGYALQEDSVNQIPHMLGRRHQGWFLASLVAPALLGSSPNVWELDPGDGAFHPDLAKSHLQLWTDAACTVKVVVF